MTERKRFTSFASSLLPPCNSLLVAIEKEHPSPAFHVDFSTKVPSSSLKGMLVKDDNYEMIDGNDYRSVDMVIRFVSEVFLSLHRS